MEIGKKPKPTANGLLLPGETSSAQSTPGVGTKGKVIYADTSRVVQITHCSPRNHNSCYC